MKGDRRKWLKMFFDLELPPENWCLRSVVSGFKMSENTRASIGAMFNDDCYEDCILGQSPFMYKDFYNDDHNIVAGFTI